MKKHIQKILKKIGYHIVKPHLHSPASDSRTEPSTKVALISLYSQLQSSAKAANVPKFGDCGFRIFSQFEEDGLLLYLAAVLEIENKTFVDIGAADCVASNCANLCLNMGWHGLFIDGNEDAMRDGQLFYKKHPDTELYPPHFKSAYVTAENINELISAAGFSGPIGVLSIDIDGNDCWIWNALEIIKPQIVVIETHIEFGERNIAVPYDSKYVYPGKHPDYHGASAPAMVSLAKKKGYRLVGANRYGFNLFFVKNEIFPERVPEVSVGSILRHPRYFERLKLSEPLKDWDFVSL
jgi:hypothetical protein